MTTPNEISAYLGVIESQEAKRWSWKYVETKSYWHIKHTETVPACEMHLEINGPALCLDVQLGAFSVRPECRTAVHYFLLRLNEALPIAKFGVSATGRISLMVEILASQVSLNTLDEILRLAIAVVTQYRREIELLAGHSGLANEVLKSVEGAHDEVVRVTVTGQESSVGKTERKE